MSRSRNSRKGSKHVKGCPGCSQCDHNRPERQAPILDDPATLAEIMAKLKTANRLIFIQANIDEVVKEVCDIVEDES